MQRREFIAGLGAAVWPIAVRAQQSERVRRVGVLMGFPAGDPEARARESVLAEGLRRLGWIEGRNLRIEYRWGVESIESTRAAVAEFVASRPDLIVATTTPHGQELVRQTRTIPIPVLFINLSDPLDTGVVANIARPGGNVTGFMSMEVSVAGKRLELLKEIMPGINRVLVLINAGNDGNLSYLRSAEAAAPLLGIRLSVSVVRGAGEIEKAVMDIAGEANIGLIVSLSRISFPPSRHRLRHATVPSAHTAWRSTSGKLYCSEFCADMKRKLRSAGGHHDQVRPLRQL